MDRIQCNSRCSSQQSIHEAGEFSFGGTMALNAGKKEGGMNVWKYNLDRSLERPMALNAGKKEGGMNVWKYNLDRSLERRCEQKVNKNLTRGGFEPPPMKTTALTLRLRPLGHLAVIANEFLAFIIPVCSVRFGAAENPSIITAEISFKYCCFIQNKPILPPLKKLFTLF